MICKTGEPRFTFGDVLRTSTLSKDPVGATFDCFALAMVCRMVDFIHIRMATTPINAGFNFQPSVDANRISNSIGLLAAWC
jgi:hypothetical protein